MLLSKLQKILLAIVIVVVASIVGTIILEYVVSTKVEQLTFTTTITISNETQFGTPFNAFIKKGYFESVGEVYVHMSSPYANYWDTFMVWMSLDNSSWKLVPFLVAPTNNLSQMTSLGLINLDTPQLTIYVKYYIPPQTIFLPPNVTKEDVSNVMSSVLIKRRVTPADRGNWLFAFLAVFGCIGFFVNLLLFSGKDPPSTTRDIRKQKRKKSREHKIYLKTCC